MITLVLEEQINVSVIKIFVPGLYSGNFELVHIVSKESCCLLLI